MILLVAWMVAFAALSARSAAAKSRSVATWAAFGAVLGPIALVILEVAPPGRCWACDAQVVGWETICQWCGTDVRPDPARASRRRLGRAVSRGQTRPATTSDPVVTASVAAVSVAAPVATPASETFSTAAEPAPPAAVPLTTRKRTTRTKKRAAASAGAAGAARSRRRSTPATRADANGTGPAVDATLAIDAAPPTETAPAVETAPTTEAAATPDAAPEDRSYHEAIGAARPSPTTPVVAVPVVASAAAASSARPPTTAADDAVAPTTRTLAGAVFVTGNVPLTPGLRYLLAMTDGRFEVRGPVDTDPTAVAFSRPAASLDAVSLNGRLILNAAEPGTDATSLVFINLRGTDADGVVETFGRLRTSPAPPP